MELKIEQVPVEHLKSAEYNPRIWTEKARHDLEKSIDEFGFIQPIVANSHQDRKGIVVGGNFKLDIAIKRGMKQVPVVWVNLNLEQEKALNLRLNKNQGAWDNALLSDFSKEMLEDVGFETVELDSIFGFVNDNSYTKTVAFATTDEQSILIKSALEKAKDCDGFIQYGKRYRQSDSLLLIINEWLKNTK
jgi:hypothetical protein